MKIELNPRESVAFRVKPEHSAAMWGKIKGGEEVELLEQAGKWAKVKYGEHDGYVLSVYVEGLTDNLDSEGEVTITLSRSAYNELKQALNA